MEAAWLRRVLAARARRLLQLRRRLRAHERLARFRGFEFSCLDASGERRSGFFGVRCSRGRNSKFRERSVALCGE